MQRMLKNYIPPLSQVHRFDNPGYLIDKSDGSCDVVQSAHISDLLPRHGHVLQQLQYGVWHVLQSSEWKKKTINN